MGRRHGAFFEEKRLNSGIFVNDVEISRGDIMRHMNSGIAKGFLAVVLLALATRAGFGASKHESQQGGSGGKQVDCTMTFTLSGWSAFYKTAHGSGTVTCEDGSSAPVKLKATGGGLTFGKSEIVNGHGKFTDVHGINDVFGSYASARAHAGVAKSAEAQVLTKGEVSLALSGTGSGVDIGIDFGKFTISRND